MRCFSFIHRATKNENIEVNPRVFNINLQQGVLYVLARSVQNLFQIY